MPNSIGNRSPEAVIEAIEENLVEASVSLGRAQDAVVFRGLDVTWVYTGYPALSRVLCARFKQEEAEDRVAEISRCFRQWDVPVLWVVGPSSWPPELPRLLGESGFGGSELWTGMALDLSELPESQNPPSATRIEAVNDAATLRAWASITADAHAGEADQLVADIFAPENAGGDPCCKYYLAYQNDTPVARAMICTRGDIAGLHWIAAAPEFHGTDIELAIARRALDVARDSGARLGVMPCHNGVTGTASKLGFSPYCQFKVFAWPSAPLPMPTC